MNDKSTIGRFVSGRDVRRIEDAGLLAGAGHFTDDFSPQRLTHLGFLRSPHADARIIATDVAAARGMPGVLAVLTRADLAAAGCAEAAAGADVPAPGRFARRQPAAPHAGG